MPEEGLMLRNSISDAVVGARAWKPGRSMGPECGFTADGIDKLGLWGLWGVIQLGWSGRGCYWSCGAAGYMAGPWG